MGKIVSNFFISLDGVVESPDQWHFPYFNDEMGAVVGEGMQNAAAFLMGRTLYEEWSSYWTTTDQDQEFAAFINGLPKYVVSSTLEKAEWNNTTVVSGDVAAQLREIKQQTAGDIQMSGSATTVRWLLANGLLDELHLLVHPIAVGHGGGCSRTPRPTR
nr:dihydrofolate reductase family protein [Planobispora longispora]